MGVTPDIIATYRGPGRVVARILAQGQREDRAIMILMAACILMFVAAWPVAAREAYLGGTDMMPIIGGTLFGLIFILPLVAYGLAWITHMGAKPFGGQGDGYGARIALFWAMLATAPFALLAGLLEGFNGPSAGQMVVEFIHLILLIWFWIAGFRVAEWGQVA